MRRLQQILPTSLGWVEAAETASASGGIPATIDIADAERAKHALLKDYARFSRLGLGFVSTLLCCFGGMFMGVVIIVAITEGVTLPSAVISTVLFAAAAALTVYTARTLMRLHRSGRRLVLALAFWAKVPYRLGERGPTSRGWIASRLVLAEPGMYVRCVGAGIVAGIALVAWLGVVSGTFGLARVDLDAGTIAIFAVWAAVTTCVACCLMSAAIRIVNAYAELDLLWETVRARFRGSALTG